MAKFEVSKAEQDLLLKIIGANLSRLKKIEIKADKDGDNKVAAGARQQQAEVEALQTKLL